MKKYYKLDHITINDFYYIAYIFNTELKIIELLYYDLTWTKKDIVYDLRNNQDCMISNTTLQKLYTLKKKVNK